MASFLSIEETRGLSEDSLVFQNTAYLTAFLETPTEEQLKFTNPLRDYAHLLSGRLLDQLIKVDGTIADYKNGLIPPLESAKRPKRGRKKKSQPMRHQELLKNAGPLLPQKGQIKLLRQNLQNLRSQKKK